MALIQRLTCARHGRPAKESLREVASILGSARTRLPVDDHVEWNVLVVRGHVIARGLLGALERARVSPRREQRAREHLAAMRDFGPRPAGRRSVAKRLTFAKKQYPPLNGIEWFWFLVLVADWVGATLPQEAANLRRVINNEMREATRFLFRRRPVEARLGGSPAPDERFVERIMKRYTTFAGWQGEHGAPHNERPTWLSKATHQLEQELLWQPRRTRSEALLPWLRREWLQHIDGTETLMEFKRLQRFSVQLSRGRGRFIRDWWTNVQPRPDINRLSFAEAAAAAQHWEQRLIRRRNERKQRHWRRAARTAHEEFRPVHTWKDGTWLGVLTTVTRDGLQGDWEAGVRALRSVGWLLGHCYRYEETALSYLEDFEMLVLFGADNVPAAMLAASKSLRSAKFSGPVLEEIRGTGNVFPESKWWPHIGSIMTGDRFYPESEEPPFPFVMKRESGLTAHFGVDPEPVWTIIESDDYWGDGEADGDSIVLSEEGNKMEVLLEGWASGIFEPTLLPAIASKVQAWT